MANRKLKYGFLVVALATWAIWLQTSTENNSLYSLNHSIVYLYVKVHAINFLSLLSLISTSPQTVYGIVSLIVFLAYVCTLYIISLEMKFKPKISMLGLIVFLSLPFIYYVLSQGLLLRLFASSISALSLALALNLTKKRLVFSTILAIIASFTYPMYVIIAAITLLIWGIASWTSNKAYAKKAIFLANVFFVILTIAYPLTYIYEPNTSLRTYMIPEFNPALYLSLTFTVIAGFLVTYATESKTLYFIVPWTTIPILFYPYLNIVGSLLATLPAIYMGLAYLLAYGINRLTMLRSNVKYEDNAWILGLFLIIILMVSSISLIAVKISSSRRAVDAGELRNIISWFSKNTTEENTLILGEINILPWIPRDVPKVEPRIIEAWSSSVFRVEAKYIRVDEWEPFSPSRAPLISIYNGSAFEKLLYIDDSYVRVHLRRNDEKWVESPYGAKFIGYKLSENKLTLIFQTTWLKIVKTITIAENSPKVTIKYSFETLRDAAIEKIEAYVWPAWGTKIDRYDIALMNIYMLIAGEHVILYPPENATAKLFKRVREQDRLILIVPVNKDKYVLKLGLEFPTAKQSPYSPLATSIFDFLKKNLKRKYIVDILDNKEPPKYIALQATLSEALYSVDAFNIVEVLVKEYKELFHISDAYVKAKIYVKENETLLGPWIEAPLNSRIVKENKSDDEVYVKFETPGLIIEKTFSQETKGYELKYSFKPKNNVVIDTVETYLWLSIEPQKHIISVNYNAINLTFSQIVFDPKPSSINITKDPEYGAPIIVVKYKAEDNRVDFTIKFQGEIKLNYTEGSRPILKEPDIVKAEGSILTRYFESPYKSTVVFEEEKENLLNITYSTLGTLYVKTLKQLDNKTTELSFKITPTKPLRLHKLNVTFWMPWERILVNTTHYSGLNNETIILTMDIGKLTIEIMPKPERIIIGPHPEYGQLRIVITVPAKTHKEIEVKIILQSEKPIALDYEKASRPTVETSDVLKILTTLGYINEVARVGNYTVIYGITD